MTVGEMCAHICQSLLRPFKIIALIDLPNNLESRCFHFHCISEKGNLKKRCSG